ncbi:hypothetical protein L4C42_01955 [Vibrio wakamikoensis]|jgi:hypothetical protein|uniref:hypothetical protein n=1 Tax=Vibrio wakamikoensis TaxID=2910251 RepID=UPI003D263E0C
MSNAFIISGALLLQAEIKDFAASPKPINAILVTLTITTLSSLIILVTAKQYHWPFGMDNQLKSKGIQFWEKAVELDRHFDAVCS